jgi:hypothetical protein
MLQNWPPTFSHNIASRYIQFKSIMETACMETACMETAYIETACIKTAYIETANIHRYIYTYTHTHIVSPMFGIFSSSDRMWAENIFQKLKFGHFVTRLKYGTCSVENKAF